MYVKREQCLSKIRRYYDANLIKVLTGIRRCGKSNLNVRWQMDTTQSSSILIEAENKDLKIT